MHADCSADGITNTTAVADCCQAHRICIEGIIGAVKGAEEDVVFVVLSPKFQYQLVMLPEGIVELLVNVACWF